MTEAVACSARLLLIVLAMSIVPIFATIAEERLLIRDFKIIAGTWRGTLTGPRGTGSYELTIDEDGSWTAVGFGLIFKGSATLVNGSARFFSETTNRAGTWTLAERYGQKRLMVLSDDQHSWGELRRSDQN